MAGSAMAFSETVHAGVKKIVAAWTSDDATGAVSGTTTSPYDGELVGLTTIPGTGGDAPDLNYDVAVTDVGGHDVLLGAGANRHNVNTEHVAKASLAAVAGSKLTIAITTAGNANKGTVVLYIR
jgi:hypothetical protein